LLDIHGKFEIDREGYIIKVTVKGEYNDIGAKAVTQGLRENIIAMDDAPFAILADMNAFVGGTPDAFSVTDEYNVWLNSKNMVAKALVFTSSVYASIYEQQIKSKSEQNIKYFDDENDARKWIDVQMQEWLSKRA
jgi:hypothetical protein